jgi:nucleoside-diphosphate-sugar epimerase
MKRIYDRRRKMKKISVFGASGFIGSRFCEMFPDITIPIPKRSVFADSPELLWLISTIDNYNVFSDPRLDIKTNLDLFIKALDIHRRLYGKSSVINLISTWFVYGEPVILPVREIHQCNPMGFYGITARTREQLLISYCQTYDLTYRIMRLANVVGVGDKKISCRKNALQFFVREIVNNRPVHLYYPDHTIRDYIYIDDVCDAIDLVLSSDVSKNRIYNIGNGVPIKFGECVESVVNRTGNDCVDHVERSDFHKIVQTNTMYLDNSNILRLGYKQTKDIWQMLDELIEYYTREKNG